MIQSINPKMLVKMYKKGYFPMADHSLNREIKFYKPLKRFIIPINNFHLPKKLFKEFKKKNIYSK